MPQTAQRSRSKHGAHISISDDNHHVTDAISSLYDYEGQGGAGSASRPLSFLPAAREEIQLGRSAPRSPTSTQPLNPSPFNPSAESRSTVDRKQSGSSVGSTSKNGSVTGKRPAGATAGGEPVSPVGGGGGGGSPTLSSPQDAAEARFPINNIDYESSPASMAQELSNLQALRRMSMNVDAAGDPDLPSFAAAPPGKSEDDPSRLFWVPARLHPELAPKEFKSFLDSRVESIKRRSGEFNVPNEDNVGRSPSSGSGGLRRKQSRLSRQIDNTDGIGAEGYHDGSEVLDRKRSGSSRLSVSTTPGSNNLNELETLMEDVSRLSMETGRKSQQNDAATGEEDVPIIPSMPGTGSLKRSTRTQYRSKRVPGQRRPPRTSESMDDLPPTPQLDLDHGSGGLQRSATDPTAKASNFSRPSRDRGQSPPSSAGPSPGMSFDDILTNQGQNHSRSDSLPLTSPTSPATSPTSGRELRDPRDARYEQHGGQVVPQIVETSAVAEPQALSPRSQRFAQEQQQLSGYRRQDQAQYRQPEQTLQSIASHPAALPGNSTGTNDLSFIPTISEEKRPEAKKQVSKKRSNDGSGSGSAGSGKKSVWSAAWGSILSSDGKDKDKEKKKKKEAKEREKYEAANAMANADDDDDVYAREKNRRNKSRHANDTRLDLLQQQIEGSSGVPGRGRESLVLDRDQVRLEEARHNERTKKSNKEDKPKEKDSLFSSIWRKKNRSEPDADRSDESHDRPKKSGKTRSSLRPASPEVSHYVELVPDIDYNWTRFSILEERAIYRMAHIKLANPRRELRSQVLLSNFMYSYLAKVQQMHPQLQIPQSAAQRKQQERQQAAERERQRKESGTPEEYYQYQQYQEHIEAQDAAAAAGAGGHEGAYVDEQGYSYDEHGNYHDGGHDPYGQGGYDYQYSQHEQSPYQYQQNQFDDPGRRDDEDDMW